MTKAELSALMPTLLTLCHAPLADIGAAFEARGDPPAMLHAHP